MTEKQFRKNQIYMHVYQKAVLMNGTIPKSPCLLDPRYCCVMSWTLFPSCLELKMQFTQPRRRTCQTFSEQEKCVLTNFHDYLCKPAYCGRVQGDQAPPTYFQWMNRWSLHSSASINELDFPFYVYVLERSQNWTARSTKHYISWLRNSFNRRRLSINPRVPFFLAEFDPWIWSVQIALVSEESDTR